MKGSNKQFTRFLESEYNDDYLEPIENNNQIDLDMISKPKSNQPQQKSNKIPNPFPPESKLENTNLKKSMVQDLVSQLGEDPRQCLEHLKSIKPIKPTSLEAYEALYTKFLTIPALFLSVTPEQTVYLWQINQRCPFRKGNQLLTDSSSMSSETCPQISFLLIAKITFTVNDQILEAGILQDNLLYVRSRTGDNELTIKFYNVEKFRNIARINPYKQEVLANEYYSYKIVIKKKFKEGNDKSLNTIEMSLWKKNAERKDELLQTKICEGLPTVDTGDGLEFNDIHCGNDGVVLVLDRETAIVIGWRNDELVVLRNKERNISSVSKTKDSIIFRNQEHHYYEVSMHNFPNIEIQDSEILASNLIYYPKLDEWRDSFEKTRKILEEFQSSRHTQSLTNCLIVYDVPWLLMNPHLMNMNTTNDHLEEEKEKSIVEKIEKKKNELKYAKSEQNSVQEKNELLKEIRADISSKIKEGIKFNEEYEAEQQKRYPKKIEEPEGVSKEALKLYSEIKAEKKKMTKNREKEKTDRKKDRLEKKEF